MATEESRKRSERRRWQKQKAQWLADPYYVALRQELYRRQRYRQRHPYTGYRDNRVQRALLFMHCTYAGVTLGGRPPLRRRCRKRLGSRYCWNWRTVGDRCQKHRR